MEDGYYTVKLRRSDDMKVKPWAEQIDGKTYYFTAADEIGREDSSIYAGEVRMIPNDDAYPSDAPVWVASGDLIKAQ